MTDLDPERLSRVLDPQRVAIIGYSSNPTRWGNRIIRSLEAGGFAGEVVIVRPRSGAPDGYRAIDALTVDEAIDIIYILVPALDAIEVVREASEAGIAAALVVSSGFSESGDDGEELQRRLVDASGDMLVFGPNCLGMANVRARMNLSTGTFLERDALIRTAGPVAIVSQSGAVGMWLTCLIEERGVKWSYLFNTGNESKITASRLALELLKRDEIETVVLYLEAVRDVETFALLCEEAKRRDKRVVVLRVGVSEDGGRAAVSHTAAVATNDFLLRAIAPSGNVIFARNELEVVTATHAATLGPLPPAPRIASVSISGGAGAMLADQLSLVGASMPKLSEATKRTLLELAPKLASADNPVDLGGDFPITVEAVRGLLSVLADSGEVDGVVFYYVHAEFFKAVFEELALSLGSLAVPTWMVWAGAPIGDIRDLAGSGRIEPSIAEFVRLIDMIPRESHSRLAAPAAVADSGAPAVEAIESLAALRGVVSESGLVDPLGGLGVSYAPSIAVDAAEAIAEALSSVPAPWVLKIDSPDIAHRAKFGLVKLGVRDPEVAREVGAEMFASTAKQFPDARKVRLLIQHQIEDAVGAFSVGAIVDEALGTFAIVGPGGADVESASADRAAIRTPLGIDEAHRALTSAEAAAGADIDSEAFSKVLAVVNAIVELPRFRELDLNPILVRPDGSLCFVDSLLVLSENHGTS